MSRDAPPPVPGYEWLTVDPRPGSSAARSGMPVAWRVHAVPATPDERVADVRDRRAACGLRAKYGWGLDLFIDAPCRRCLKVVLAKETQTPLATP